MKKIVWLGPMGEDKPSKRAVEVTEFFLDGACREHGFELYLPQTLGAENWLNSLLNEIRFAAGIICDISGERCNVYFELGYANALKVPTIILCQTETAIHVDLSNIQYHAYETIPDIKQLVHKWLAGLTCDYDHLSNVTSSLPHPFTLLEGDGHHEYVYNPALHSRPFKIEEVGPPLTLESLSEERPDLGPLVTQIHQLQAEIAAKTFRPFFDGELIGYMDHTPQRNDSGSLLGADIAVRRTTYCTFAATHYPHEAIDQARELSLLDDEAAEALHDRINERVKSDSWPFAMPITAMVFLIVESDSSRILLFQRRNRSKNFHALFEKQTTAGGMVHPTQILDPVNRSRSSPEYSFLQEMIEEAGIQLPVHRIRILGLVREDQWRECGLVGFAVTNELELGSRKLPVDSFESNGFDSVELRPASIADYLKSCTDGSRSLTPLTLAALALLLVHEFGFRAMGEIFAEAES